MKIKRLVGAVAGLCALAAPWPVLAQLDPFALEGVPEAEAEPRIQTFDNEISLGAGYLSDDAVRFGRYTGLTDERVEPLLDFRLQARPAWDGDSTTFWRLEGARVGLDSRRLEGVLGQQGTQRLRIGYREIPKNQFDDGRTPFQGIGSTFLSLPPGWTVTGNTTAAMPQLQESLRGVGFDERRRRLDVGYQRQLPQGFSFNVDYRREMKEGTRPVGGVIGNSGGNPRAAILPAPVDFVTDIVDATLDYTARNYQFGIGYHGSFFQNERNSLTWQNPFGQTPGWADGVGFPDGQGRLALEPDNSFHQIRAFGLYRFTPTTQINADVAFGRMRQDEVFLPYTVNPNLDVPLDLPRNSLNGKIDTRLVNLRLSSQPLAGLSLVGRYRFDERDNRTAQDTFVYVGGDSENQKAPEAGRINLPFSLTRHTAAFDATYRLFRRARVVAGYEFTDIDRDFSEVSSSQEHTFRAGLRANPVDIASLSLTYAHSRRDAGSYVGNRPFIASHVPGTVDPDDFENHPLLRKYYITDRDRDQVSFRSDLFPVPEINVGLAASYSRDDYDDKFFGLNEARIQAYTVDLGYFPLPNVNLTGFYTHERFDSDQSGRSFAPGQAGDIERNWFVDNRDRIDTVGVNLELTNIGERLTWLHAAGLTGELDLGFGFVHARSRGKIDVTSGALLNTLPLPELKTRLTSFSVYGRYHFTPAASLRVGFEHERYRSRDFALDDVTPTTMANVLSLGNASQRYSVNWITAAFIYRW